MCQRLFDIQESMKRRHPFWSSYAKGVHFLHNLFENACNIG